MLHSPTGLGNPVATPAIVVADDDAPSRLLIARYLQQLHLSNPVVEAANGQQAIEVLAALETTPALVLLDVNMPEKSGLQVLAWIRDHARLSPVPVVILTGSAELEDVDQAYGLGISAYLLKPLSSTALDDALRALGTPWMLLALNLTGGVDMRWRLFLAAGVVAAVAFVLAPVGGVLEAAIFTTWNGAAVTAIAAGVRRHRPQPAWPWNLFLAAHVLYWLTTVAWLGYPLVAGRPLSFPSILDPLYWLAYLGWIVSLTAGVRLRARRDRGAILDAAIVTAGVSVAGWKLLIEPMLGTQLPAAVMVASVTYPVLLTLAAAVALHATLVPGRVRTVQLLLMGWLTLELAADVWYSVASVEGLVAYHDLWLAVWLLSFTSLGALGLHPGLPSLARARGPEPTHRRRARLTVVFLAGLLPLAAVMGDIASMNHDGNFSDTLGLQVIGVLVVLAIVVRLSLSAGDLTEQQRLREKLEHTALHDQLTGLVNRIGFDQALWHAMAVRHDADRAAMVVLGDLDGFKAVNDTYGHHAGDELLRQVAARLTEGVRDADTVARLGGDEFAIVVDDIEPAEGLALADRLATAVNQPIDIGPATPAVSVSLGVYRTEAGDAPDEVMRRADTAMYAAKTSGGGVQLFDAQRHRHFLDRYRLESELRAAPAAGELVVHYQPIVRLDGRDTVAVEALVRWQHPRRGLLIPAEFIDLAETSGAIIDIGRWVLNQACHDATNWLQLVAERADWRGVTVNVSRRQLDSATLVSDVADALDRSGLPAHLLTLEVTETALADDAETMIAVMHELKNLGVHLAMDDFGTGYSSLADLQQIPTDVLKIDRTFVAGLARSEEERTLASAILRLAASLGKRTLAEGIEETAQLVHLRSLGCELGQGYLFAKPMPVDDLTAHLRSQAPRVSSS